MAKSVEGPIKASEVLKAIEAGKAEVEVENDGDCEPGLFGVTIEGHGAAEPCSMTAYYCYREDQPTYGVSLGDIVVRVDGVEMSAERIAAGEHEPFEVSGREIEYDGGLTEKDLVAAVEEHVRLPEYDSDSYWFDESGVTDEDLRDNVDDTPEVFAMKDDEIYGFDDEEEIPADGGFEVMDGDEAIEAMVSNRQNLEFEQWG